MQAYNMFPGHMQGQNPVKVAPKMAISGTPTVVPPPLRAGRQNQQNGYVLPMNQQNQQNVYVMYDTYQQNGSMPNGYGYPFIEAMPYQNAQQMPQNPQNHQAYPNQSTDAEEGGTVSAAWRRRQRRRAQRNGNGNNLQKQPGTPSTVTPNMSRTLSAVSTVSGGMSRQSSNDVEEQEIPEGELLVGDPHILVLNNNLANEAIEQLENGTREERSTLLHWITPATLDLALSVSGCRVVQAAVEVAGGEHRHHMTRQMHGHVVELLDSPHGNHVLQKCIEVLPPDTIQFVVDELCAFPDHGLSIAKHRFGCRILERLMEHCPADQTRVLVEDVIANAYVLCRHPFGNYVVQHILEYGTQTQRSVVIDALLQGGVMQLAMHRVASNVIERALGQCNAEDRRLLVNHLVSDPSTTLAMASSRYGSFIAQRLLELPASPLLNELRQQLYAGLDCLKASKHGKQLVAIIAPEEAETETESGPEEEQTDLTKTDQISPYWQGVTFGESVQIMGA